MQEASEKKHAAIIENERARESGQVKAMAMSKKAVEGEYMRLIVARVDIADACT